MSSDKYDEFPKISSVPMKGRKKQRFKNIMKEIDLSNLNETEAEDDFYIVDDYMKRIR